MSAQPSPEKSLDTENADSPAQGEPLFTIVRGSYDEEGEGRLKPWSEQNTEEPATRLTDIDKLRASATLEGMRAGRKHELQKSRDAFERRFTTWIPYSQAEMTLAVTGLSTMLNKILGNVGPNTLAMTERYYKAAEDYYRQASIHLENLKDAKVFPQDLRPSTDRIRQIPEIKHSIASYVQAKHFLERLKWNPRKGQRKSSKPLPRDVEYQEILDGISRRSDEELIALWERSMQCAHSRREFWEREIINAETSNELVEAIKTEDKIRRT